MSKVRVPVYGTVGRSVNLNPDATFGAQLGVDLFDESGNILTLDGLSQIIFSQLVNSSETNEVIFEEQIVDGTLLARVADDEIVTGNWDFDTLTDFGAGLRIYDATDTDSVTFSHDGADFNITGVSTLDLNLTGFTTLQAGTVDADFDAITATSYGGIVETNLLDKTATETRSGSWTISGATYFSFAPRLNNNVRLNALNAASTINVNLAYLSTLDKVVLAHAGLETLIQGSTIEIGGTLNLAGNTIDMGTNTFADADVANWNTAYGWGDHTGLYELLGTAVLLAGADQALTGTYRSTNNANIDGANFSVNTTTKSITEYAYEVLRTDATVGGIFIDGKFNIEGNTVGNTQVTNWNTAYGWGDHALAGYAAASHTHDASDVISGVFSPLRLASAQHGHTATYGFVGYNRVNSTDLDTYTSPGFYGLSSLNTNGPSGYTYDAMLVLRNSDVGSQVIFPRNGSQSPIAYRGYSSSGAAISSWKYTGWTTTRDDADLSLYAKAADYLPLAGGGMTGALTISTVGSHITLFDTANADPLDKWVFDFNTNLNFYHYDDSALTWTLVQENSQTFTKFNVELFAGTGFSTQGIVSDVGQVGQFTFVDVSAGIGRVGSYNYDTAVWMPMKVEGTTVEIDANGGVLELTGTGGISLNNNVTADGAITASSYIDSASYILARAGSGGSAMYLDSTASWVSGTLYAPGLRWREADGTSVAGIRGYVNSTGLNRLTLGTGWLSSILTLGTDNTTLTTTQSTISGDVTILGNSGLTIPYARALYVMDSDTVTATFEGTSTSGSLVDIDSATLVTNGIGIRYMTDGATLAFAGYDPDNNHFKISTTYNTAAWMSINSAGLLTVTGNYEAYKAASDVTLDLMTDPEYDTRLGLYENTSKLYGFSLNYDGLANQFELKRHDNNATGVDVITILRSSSTVNLSGALSVGSTILGTELRGRTAQHLVLNAGESHVYATGQTAELVYVNAEGGLQINSSPDNWVSGWAGRTTATINAAGGASTFPGAIVSEVSPPTAAFRSTQTGSYIQLGPNATGQVGNLGSRYQGDASANRYGTYWASDAYWDESAKEWVANRTNLGRKWKVEMGYHIDAFQIDYYAPSPAGLPWAESAWTNLFHMSPSTAQYQTNLYIDDGHVFRVYDSLDTDYIQLDQSASQATISSTQHIYISPGSGHDVFIFDSGSTAGLRIYDKDGTDYGRFYHNGVGADFKTDFTNTTAWKIGAAGTQQAKFIIGNPSGTGETSALTLKDHNGTNERFAGFADSIEHRTNVAFTMSAQDSGNVAMYTNTTAYTITTSASTDLDFPVGHRMDILTTGTGVITIAAGISTTLYWDNGGGVAFSTGSRTITRGWATIWRRSSTEFYITGSGLA